MRCHALRGWVLAVVAGFCLVNAARALDSNKKMSQFIHDAWGADRGFSGAAVYAICQSEDGYLWIGTDRGLVRFDGLTFTQLPRPLPNSPPLGPVRGLVSDAEGNLWIRLDGPRLLLYRDGKFEDALARFGLQDLAFTAMSLDNHGGLLLSGLGHPTLHFRNGKFETIANAEEIPGTVISLAETRDGRIWMGTRDDGLFRIDQGRISNVARALANSKVNALLPANNGGLWIGLDAGIKFWDGNGLTDRNLPASINQLQVLAMTKDREGNVWVGSDHGLLRINHAGAASLELVNHIPGNQVTAVFEDHDGDLWFGGPRGIERLRDGVFSTYSTSKGLPAGSSGPLYVDSEGRTWFAPLSGGLFWLKDDHVGRVTDGGLDHDVVYSISGGDGEVWVGRQTGGLSRLTKRGESFDVRTYTRSDGLAQNSVCSVHRNHDGTVWAGTVSAGLSELKDGTFTNYSTADGLASNAVNSIVEGFDSTMWIATPNGLSAFTGKRWTNRYEQDRLPSSNIRSIFEDSAHVLWIATSNGLASLSSGRVQVPPNIPDLLRDQIFGMAEGKRGSLWISTSDHFIQVDRNRLLAGTLGDSDLHSYGISDGLQGVEGVRRDRSVVADPLGRVWVSLNRGLAVADPKLTASTSAPDIVRIESISVGGSQFNRLEVPKIAPGSQGISFNFASTNLSLSERVRFRYKLDGSGQGWSDIVALRQVNYPHLDPGSYTFRVIASNSEGLWNGPETTVSFVVEPAYWQTWWFRVSCLSACIFAAAVLYRLRMHQLTRRLNVRFQERLAERTRIAQELHDTLLQGFISASMQLDVAEDQLQDDSPTKPVLRRILQLMGRVTEESRTTLQGLRKSESDDRCLELAFSRIRQEFAVHDNVGYRVIAHNAARPLRPMIRDEVYRISREALVNAFLHARAGSVEVEVEYASQYLRVLVRDDGCGIDPQVLHSGREGHWGLPGMRERSESIGARLRLRSRIGAGTEVELTVPSAIAFEGQSHGPFPQWLAWLNREKFASADSNNNRRGHP